MRATTRAAELGGDEFCIANDICGQHFLMAVALAGSMGMHKSGGAVSCDRNFQAGGYQTQGLQGTTVLFFDQPDAQFIAIGFGKGESRLGFI